MKKQREAARSIEVAKKKAEKQRQNDIDRLKQQKMEESAKMEAEEEKKRKKVESELVRILRIRPLYTNLFYLIKLSLFLFNRGGEFRRQRRWKRRDERSNSRRRPRPGRNISSSNYENDDSPSRTHGYTMRIKNGESSLQHASQSAQHYPTH
jgi:hypothetical protein